MGCPLCVGVIAISLMQDGIPLALRNISSMVVVLFATTILAQLGAVALAAHEVVRSVWILAIQGFTAFDITAQTLVATHLGKVSAAFFIWAFSSSSSSTCLASPLSCSVAAST